MTLINDISRYIKIFLYLLKKRTITFLNNRIDKKTFILLSSAVVGVFASLGAVVLKTVVHFFQIQSKNFFNQIGIPSLFIFLPLLGIFISLLIVKFFFKGKITRGLSNIIYLIIRKKSDIPPRKILSHLLTSGATVGTGGSVGLEAPIVVIGAAIGSNVAKELKLNYHYRTLLLACGSAAGISAIFNSPIAGVIFAFEVLLPDISISSFIPLLIASAISSIVSKLLYSGQIFFFVTEGWKFQAIPFYFLLGIFSGFISLYMKKITAIIEKHSENKSQIKKTLVGGIALCILIFLFPPLFGEGYSSIINLLNGNEKILLGFGSDYLLQFSNIQFAIIIYALLIIFIKVIATSLTLYAGGNGGIIAPSLFTGAMTGFLFSYTINTLGISNLIQPNFIVVGMAGILAGVLHAPLTGIFLIAEITGGYLLIVPLMIVTAISFFISKYFNKYSIYTAALSHRGIDFRSEKEKFAIQNLTLKELLEDDFEKITPNMKIGDLIELIQHSKRNLFPVVNEENILIGVVTLDDIREVILQKEIYNVLLVYEIMDTNFISIDIEADINQVIKIFEENQVWNIAVTENGKYKGFVSKSNLFNRYISLWHKQRSEEI